MGGDSYVRIDSTASSASAVAETESTGGAF